MSVASIFGSRAVRVLSLVLSFSIALSSCAYYNTFYLARKYYDKATAGLPYLPDKGDQSNTQNFNQSIEYSKKLLAQYPKDKLVDDAYLLWARALLGTDDPRQSIKLLEDFPTRFPKSSLASDAKFFLAVAYRQARKNKDALRVLDDYMASASHHHNLLPYAHLERSRVLMLLERPEEAAAAVGEVLAHYPKFRLIDKARLQRAEALLAQGAHQEARQAFRDLGSRATTDEERLGFLLREADCLEAARKYDDELKLLNDALAHQRAPVPADTTGGNQATPQVAGSDGYGRLLVRVGSTHLLAGRKDEALDAYRRVVRDYARTPLAAEAQYRIGFAYETAADDFDKARAEYTKVRDQGAGTFMDQATLRLSNLERLAQFRSSGGDSVEKQAEAGFLLAELYLFQLEKPERALEEYRKIANQFGDTSMAAKAMAAKAMNAQAWVLSRKLKRNTEADSLFWSVVREYPATEAQLAARDYLELEGVSVPEDLIKLPEPKYARVDTAAAPSLPPIAPTALASPPGEAPFDTIPRLGPRTPGLPQRPVFLPPFGIPPPTATTDPGPRRTPTPTPPPAAVRSPTPRDTSAAFPSAPRDSAGASPFDPDEGSAPPDSSGGSAPADSSKVPR